MSDLKLIWYFSWCVMVGVTVFKNVGKSPSAQRKQPQTDMFSWLVSGLCQSVVAFSGHSGQPLCWHDTSQSRMRFGNSHQTPLVFCKFIDHTLYNGLMGCQLPCYGDVTVAAVFKRKDRSYAAGCGPISLACRVLEHIMASQVVEHMNKYDLLCNLQHRFGEKRSCETQLAMLVEDLSRNLSAWSRLWLTSYCLIFPNVWQSESLQVP